MQTFQRRACSRNHLLFWLSYLGPCSSHPSHPKARCQTLRENPSTSEPTELIQTSQSWACWPGLASRQKPLEEPSLTVHFSLSVSWLTSGFEVPPPLGNSNEQSFQCLLSPDMLAASTWKIIKPAFKDTDPLPCHLPGDAERTQEQTAVSKEEMG